MVYESFSMFPGKFSEKSESTNNSKEKNKKVSVKKYTDRKVRKEGIIEGIKKRTHTKYVLLYKCVCL